MTSSSPNDTESLKPPPRKQQEEEAKRKAKQEFHRMRDLDRMKQAAKRAAQPVDEIPAQGAEGFVRQLSRALDNASTQADGGTPGGADNEPHAQVASTPSRSARSPQAAQTRAPGSAVVDQIVGYLGNIGKASGATGTELASVIDEVLADLESGTPPQEINQNPAVARLLQQMQARLKPLSLGVSRPADPKSPQSRRVWDPNATAEHMRSTFLAQSNGDTAAMENNPQYRKAALEFADWLNVENLSQGFGAQAQSLFRGAGLQEQASHWISNADASRAGHRKSRGAQAGFDDLSEDKLKYTDKPRTTIVLPEALDFGVEPDVARISRNGQTVTKTDNFFDVEILIPEEIKAFRRRIIHDRLGDDAEIGDLMRRQNALEWLMGSSTFHSYLHTTRIRREGMTKAEVTAALRLRPEPDVEYPDRSEETPAVEGDYDLAIGLIPGEEGQEPKLTRMGGLVYHMVDEEAGAVANVTSNFHFLDPGYVIRWVKEEPDGSFTIYSLGQGNGMFRESNEWAGASLFWQLDKVVANDLGATIQEN